MAKEKMMIISSVRSLSKPPPYGEIIEISDSDDDDNATAAAAAAADVGHKSSTNVTLKIPMEVLLNKSVSNCKAFSKGTCRRLQGLRNSLNVPAVSKVSPSIPLTQTSGSLTDLAPKINGTPLKHKFVNGATNHAPRRAPTHIERTPSAVVHNNNNGDHSFESKNGVMQVFSAPGPQSSKIVRGPAIEEGVSGAPTMAIPSASRVEELVDPRTIATRVPRSASFKSSKRFLKPPSPKNALTKEEFRKLSLEDVQNLITRFGPNMVQNISPDEILRKGLSELKPQKNIKTTPRLHPIPIFGSPISPDDEVIVISDTEPEENNGLYKSSQITSDTPRQTKTVKCQAQEDFLSNLQLSSNYKYKKPFKKDIAGVLKTRNNMKAYITNPLVNILKADCIYKYVTAKGILSSEQFRARYEVPRRCKKSRTEIPASQKVTTRRRTLPTCSDIEVAEDPPRPARRSMSAKLRSVVAEHERAGVWTSFSPKHVTDTIEAPVIALHRIDDRNSWEQEEWEQGKWKFIGRPVELECPFKSCSFHCLNPASLRYHRERAHGRGYT